MAITDLAGKRVLLTGASGGLGHAIARRLHSEGAKLVLSARREEILKDLATEIGADVIAADLGDLAEIDRVLAAAGNIDVLVVNHALPATGRLLDLSPEDIEKLIQLNLLGAILMARKSAEAMVARGSGHIVLMGSVASKAPTEGASMYNATKFGIRGFGLAARQDLHGTGVGMSVVMPGFVREAGMWADTNIATPSGIRTVSPEQVAKAVSRVIRRDKAEVTVAPAELKLLANINQLAPGLAETLARTAVKPGYIDTMITNQSVKK